MCAWRSLMPLAFLALAVACDNPVKPTPPIDLAGTWSLQTRASTSCANNIPADTRNRSYSTIVITQASGMVTMVAPGMNSGIPLLVGGVDGGQIQGQFDFNDGAPNNQLVITGYLTATVDSARTTTAGTLNGAFIPWSVPNASCVAADHQMTFTKR